MPVNCIARYDDIETVDSDSILPKNYAGIISPASVIRIITQWEIFENDDGTKTFAIKDDSLLSKLHSHLPSCISNLKVSIPVIPNVEYHSLKLRVFTPLIWKEVSFVLIDGKYTASVDGVLWTKTYRFPCNVQLTVSFTASPEASAYLALIELSHKYDNIILTKSLTRKLRDTFDSIRIIQNSSGTLTWKNEKEKSNPQGLIYYSTQIRPTYQARHVEIDFANEDAEFDL